MGEDQPQKSTRPRQTGLYRRIVRVMNVGFVTAIVIMFAGLLIGIGTGDHVDRQTDNLGDVIPGVLRLQAQDVVELGILILLATPAAYVVVALATFVRDRDVLFIGVSLALLGIVALSVGASLQ